MQAMRALTLAASFVAVVAIAAGCGGGNDDGAAPATTAAPPPSVTTTQPASPASTAPPSTSATTTRSAVTTGVATTVARTDIRRTDWLATLRGTSGFSVDTTSPGTSAKEPFINISYAPALAGYAVLDSVAYGDISGDGFDEAIITLYSGGTAGNTGLLVYQVDASNKISLVGPNDFYTSFGYKAYGQPDQGDLVVGNVVSAGWEPNCCQSGFVERRFRISGGRMTQQGQPAEAGYLAARSNTIEHFYALINAKQFDVAYQFTSPAFQAREPFDKWKSGYAATKSVDAQAVASEAPGPVKFTLTAVDSTAASEQTRTYTGVWTLVYSTTKHQWLLDTAEVQLGG
jgi:hypothetical protein